MRWQLSVPPDNDRGPQHVAQLLTVLLAHRRMSVGLEYGASGGAVGTFLVVPDDAASAVREQVADVFPDAALVESRNGEEEHGPVRLQRSMRLVPDCYPLRTDSASGGPLEETAYDPATALLSAVRTASQSGLQGYVSITLQPASVRRRRRSARLLRRLEGPLLRDRPGLRDAYARLACSASVAGRAAALAVSPCVPRTRQPGGPGEEKLSEPLLYEAHVTVGFRGRRMARRRLREFLTPLTGAFAQFATDRCRFVATRPHGTRTAFLMSAAEAAALWHPPAAPVRVARLDRSAFRELEPPARLPSAEAGGAPLGRTLYRDRREPVVLPEGDRFRHLGIVGKTGMGKTTLLQSLLASDIAAGRGVGLIDPHGDMATGLLGHIPRHRTNDVLYFDPADRSVPVAFNPLDCPDPELRPLVASGVLSAFKKLFGDSWGPRLEHILRHALLTLCEHRGTTLVSLRRLLGDGAYRRSLVDRLSDPVVRAFWTEEFEQWKPQFRAEAVAPVLNKIGQFVSNPLLRAVLDHPRDRVDLRGIMDNGRILLANLSKGRVGEDASTLLGALLVTQLQIAAMRRAEVPETERRPFFAYVDEFQNFATDSFATVLSEARKYGLALTVAHQYLDQLDEQTRDALFGNVGSLVAFQVGVTDAETLAEQLGQEIRPAELTVLPRYTAVARLFLDGQPTRPFTLRTVLPEPVRRAAQPQIVLRTSRHRYGRPSDTAERPVRKASTV